MDAFAVVDFNGWDDVVNHVWTFPTREAAEAFCRKYDGYGLLVYEIEDADAWAGPESEYQ